VTAADAPLRRTSLDAPAASLLVVLCFSWGLNQVAIKVADGGMQPVFQAGLRSAIGCVLVVAWCWVRGVPLFGRDGTLAAGLLAGTLFCTEFILIFIGLDYTSVARGVLFLYTMPFVVAAGAHLLIPGERLTTIRVIGLVAAFVGVVIALSDRLSLPSPTALSGDGLCLLAGFVWGATTLVIRTTRLNFAAPEKVLAYQLAVAGVVSLALAPLFGPFFRAFDWVVAVAFAYQAVVVVVATYLAWFWMITRYPATKLTAFAFLTPLFGAALGGLLLAEAVSVNLLAALALVAAGIYLVNR
jgi:drug/metabolite transporter (DMT)-like permease